ncbi:MAG: SAM-dependent methyltransferase [Congregibacter sp.]|jgi:SAM-dependent methyltransferase
MMTVRSDTFERSCEHWSDAGREEMEAFYELARVDYRYLAEAYHWTSAFQSLASRKIGGRLIDVACGSGKFPQALLASPGVADLSKSANFKLNYDLLDPSDFSLREAKQALAPPFHVGSEFCCTLQNWDEEAGLYDIAWATHALYCVPTEELEQGLARMCSALAQDGFGFIAQGMRDGHYVGFYDEYLASMTEGDGTPYSDGAQVEAALKNLGMHVRTRVLDYTTVVPADRPELLESYLQRCAFDDTFGLEEMLQREPLAGYLASCHDLDSGDYRFPQRVGMILFSHTEAGLTLRDAKVSGVD